jgi:hypothetical protein
MKDDLKGLMEVRDQTAKIMKRAELIVGGREALARHLGVEPYRVGEWTARLTDAPHDVVSNAVDVIVNFNAKKSQA